MRFNTYFVAFSVLSLLPYSSCCLGNTSCQVYGQQDVKCKQPLIDADKLPEECTSILFDGFTITSDNIVSTYLNIDSFAVTKSIQKKTKKPLYLYVGRLEWECDLDVEGKTAKNDAALLKKFLDGFDNQVAGIILRSITDNLKSESDINPKLKVYITEIKKSFPKLEIGVDLLAVNLMSSDQPSKLLDFNCLSDSVDFYTINMMFFNYCDEKYRDGVAPLECEGTGATLEKLDQKITEMCIEKDKVYFGFELNANRPSEEIPGATIICDGTHDKICKDPATTKNWCADTSVTFRQKGNFSTEYGGFIGVNIDLDDPTSTCGCDKPYPGFHYMVDGINGKDDSKPCKKFDRTP